MKSTQTHRPIRKFFAKRKKTKIVLLVLLVVFAVVRPLLPVLILNHTNHFLETFSPVYGMHVEDLDLNFLRMAYTSERVTGYLKANNSQEPFEFASIKKIDVSLAWREIFRGRFVADVDVTEADLRLTTKSIQAVSGYDPKQVKSDAKKVKDKTIPFNLERLRIKNSKIIFSNLEGMPLEQSFRISEIEGMANNLTPKEQMALSIFSMTGSMQGTARMKMVGQLRLNQQPADWSSTIEMRNFDLRTVNPIAKQMIPFTFDKGVLSMYAASRSTKGNIEGYVKPFFRDLTIIGDHGDFKNMKQFFLELAGTIGNFLLKNRENKAVATKVEFKTVNGKLQVDTGKAVALLIDNAFGDPLTPTLEETLDLK